MTASRSAPIQFRDGDLTTQLTARGENLNQMAATLLDEYLTLLAAELRVVRWTAWEAATVVGVLQSTALDTSSIPLLWAEVDEALGESGMDARGEALVAKLRALTLGQRFAVADAVRRWRRLPQGDDRLRQAGFVLAD